MGGSLPKMCLSGFQKLDVCIIVVGTYQRPQVSSTLWSSPVLSSRFEGKKRKTLCTLRTMKSRGTCAAEIRTVRAVASLKSWCAEWPTLRHFLQLFDKPDPVDESQNTGVKVCYFNAFLFAFFIVSGTIKRCMWNLAQEVVTAHRVLLFIVFVLLVMGSINRGA